MTLFDSWLGRVESFRPVREARLRAAWFVRRLSAALAQRSTWAPTVGVILAVQAWLIVTHEPWRDEWQAVQIAVQSPTWADLLENLRYEGHPPLWYLLLRGLSHWFDPATALPAAALICALPAQLALLLAAPFRRAERMLLASSQFLLFEYFTVSRSLTLGVALIIVALALHRSRWGWVAITLLPMCDFLFGVISLALIALRWRDGRLWLPGLALWAGIGLAAAWTVRPEPSFTPEFAKDYAIFSASAYLERLGSVLLPLQWRGGPVWDATLPLLLSPFAWLACLMFFRSQTRGNRLETVLLFGFVAVSGLLSALVYSLSVRHVMLAAIVLVALAWSRGLRGRRLSPGFDLWLLGAAACGILSTCWSAFVPFDSTRQFAQEIERRGLAEEHWMSLPAAHAQGVSAMTGTLFERPQQHCMQSFIRWNYRSTLKTERDVAQYLQRQASRRGGFLLVSSYRFGEIPIRLARPLFHVPAGYNGQSYYAYEIGSDRPRFTGRLPLCVPEQRALERLS